MTTIAVAVNHISWTFHNYGPLTTTFTPAPTCTGTSRINLGTIEDNFPYVQYSVQCETTTWPDCEPSSTITPMATTAPRDADDDPWTSSVGHYYSPGLYCPSGWETVGVAGREGDQSYTTSGVMSFGTSHWTPDFNYMPTVLAKGLKPSETAVMCCPSGYSADPLGGCFQTVPSYTPTAVCEVYDDHSRSVIKSTSTYTTDGTPIQEIVRSTTTVHSYTTYSTVVGDEYDAEFYVPIIYLDAITLIHHKSDVVTTGKTGTTTETGTGTGSTVTAGMGSTTGTAASTSNAAARLALRGSSWSGLGAVLGVSLCAVALGAAIILPF